MGDDRETLAEFKERFGDLAEEASSYGLTVVVAICTNEDSKVEQCEIVSKGKPSRVRAVISHAAKILLK